MKIISIDPGGTTGYCYARITDDKNVEYFPFQQVDDVDECFMRVRDFQPRYIIMENFEYRNRARSGLDLFPVQLIGVVRLYELTAPGGNCAVYLQSAAVGKGYYTDTILKHMNLYKRAIPHGMDASRHLLQWLTFGAGYQFIDDKKEPYKLLSEWSDT